MHMPICLCWESRHLACSPSNTWLRHFNPSQCRKPTLFSNVPGHRLTQRQDVRSYSRDIDVYRVTVIVRQQFADTSSLIRTNSGSQRLDRGHLLTSQGPDKASKMQTKL